MARSDHENKRKLTISEQRQIQVIELYFSGLSMNKVAARLGVNVNTVAKDINRARKSWKDLTAQSYDERLPQKLAEVRQMRQQAWEGWKRSIRSSRRKSHTEYTGGEGGGSESTTTTTERRDGDPRFLSVIEKYQRLECQLMGLLDGKPEEKQQTPVFVEVVVNNREEVDQFETITVAQFKETAQTSAG